MTWPCDEFEARLAMLPEIYRERRGDEMNPDQEVSQVSNEFLDALEELAGTAGKGLL